MTRNFADGMQAHHAVLCIRSIRAHSRNLRFYLVHCIRLDTYEAISWQSAIYQLWFRWLA